MDNFPFDSILFTLNDAIKRYVHWDYCFQLAVPELSNINVKYRILLRLQVYQAITKN